MSNIKIFGGINCKFKNIFFRFYSAHTWEQPTGYDTQIKVHNCVARKKVPLIVKNKNLTTWYACGPTVYDSPHIGHASCYVKQDIMQRILRDYFQINLVTAMNITDIDDKIIKKSIESQERWDVLAKRYETEFWDDLGKLGVTTPNLKVRVSDYIPDIIEFIQKLLDDDKAYTSIDGSVYFDVSKQLNYGKLQNINTENEEHEMKKSSMDFALWKGVKPNEPFWSAPWGNGRPGWHIECSAMASILFGSSIDIHSGGLDLRFPHHENEEAQSCAHHNTNQWINYWFHTGQLHVQGQKEKMSKSLKNTISVAELLKSYSAEQFRMACVLSNYSNQMDYGNLSMERACSILKRLQDFQIDTDAYISGLKPRVPFSSQFINEKIIEAAENIDGALKDNFNTAKCIEHILDLVANTNKIINDRNDLSHLQQSTDLGVIKAVQNFVTKNLGILGFDVGVKREHALNTNINGIETILDGVLQIRSNIRENAISSKNKDLFKTCDNIRDMLKTCGVEVKDHGKLSSWNFVNNKK